MTGESRPLYAVGIIILGVLFAADVVTTSLALAHGGAELNAFMAPVSAFPVLHAILKVGMFVFIAGVIHLVDRRLAGSGLYLLALVIGFYAWGIGENVAVLLRLMNG